MASRLDHKWTTKELKGLRLVAIFGLLISLWMLCASFFTYTSISSSTNLLLFFCCFFLFAPPVLELSRKQSKKPMRDVGLECLRLNPGWMKVVLCLLCLPYFFCMIYGLFHLDDPSGSPEIINGKMVLAERGHIVKELTPEEYREIGKSEDRSGTYHFAFLYYFEILMYNGIIRQRSRLQSRKEPMNNP